MAKKKVKKTRETKRWNNSTGSYETFTETYFVFENTTSYSDYCGSGGDASSSSDSGGYCGE